MSALSINGYTITIDDDGRYVIDGVRVKEKYNDIKVICQSLMDQPVKTSTKVLNDLAIERAESEPYVASRSKLE